MATRNLTELFFILQNNTIYNKNIFSEENADGDKLLQNNNTDDINGQSSFIYPDWISKYEDAQYFLTKLKIKIDDLSKLQDKHLRSVMKENTEEETEIEVVSQNISKLITSTHSHIKSINSCSSRGKDIEKKLLNNIVKSLSMTLQDLSNKFKDGQGSYIHQINSIEKRSNAMFELLDFNTENPKNNGFETFDEIGNYKSKHKTVLDYEDDQIDEFFELPAAHNIEQKKLMLMEMENTRMIEDRESDVIKIVNSLIDLNDIFKDLANIVQEQGTILDRIDYSVEQTQTRVVEGFKQLQKADVYQRKNKKIYCILCLASTILILLVLLIFTKF